MQGVNKHKFYYDPDKRIGDLSSFAEVYKGHLEESKEGDKRYVIK